MRVVNEPIVAVSRAAFKRQRNRADVASISESLRRRRNEDGGRIEMR
jgi:hypothetical protein